MKNGKVAQIGKSGKIGRCHFCKSGESGVIFLHQATSPEINHSFS
jgi:hypothetical protein